MKTYTDDEIKWMAGKYEIDGYIRGFRNHEKLSNDLINLVKNNITDDLESRTKLMENVNYDINVLEKIDSRIINQLKFNGVILEIDYILETLTKLGFAPNLVYDDNGLFGVSSDGFQQVVTGDEKVTEPITICVEENIWCPTIREAVMTYINGF